MNDVEENNHVNNPRCNRGRRFIRIFAAGIILALFIGCILPFIWRPKSTSVSDMQEVAQIIAVLVGLMGLFVLLPAYLFPNLFSRLFRREMIQRYVFGLACAATLIAGFYAIENWRGQRAWETCKRELEAKGAVLDWTAFIPPAVPDEQNVFAAPNMTEWFVKKQKGIGSTKSPFERLPGVENFVAGQQSIAHVQVISPGDALPTEPGAVIYDFDQTNFIGASQSSFLEKVEKLVEDRTTSVPAAEAPRLDGPQTITFVAREKDQLPPLRLYVRAAKARSAKELEERFASFATSATLLVEPQDGAYSPTRVRPRPLPSKDKFFLTLKAEGREEVAAEDYLEWSDQFAPEFDLIRTALQRPYARLNGDYQYPYAQPIPNFVSIRMVAQTLAQRGQCYLLLNEPQKALRELTLLHDFRRLLERKPENPHTIVEAMINVAVVGLHQTVVADGFRLGVWQEPQILELAEQQSKIEVIAPLSSSLHHERAGITHMLLNASSTAGGSLFRAFHGEDISLLRRLKDPEWLMFDAAPKGWIQQNVVVMASLHQKFIEGMQPSPRGIDPAAWKKIRMELEELVGRKSVYTYVAQIALPNVTRAVETAAMNQCKVRQGLIACALERYRLAHGSYPETLEVLSPEFIVSVPQDIIGEIPMKYRRTEDGKFLLYSIGWNEKDDGGVAQLDKKTVGDWVW